MVAPIGVVPTVAVLIVTATIVAAPTGPTPTVPIPAVPIRTGTAPTGALPTGVPRALPIGATGPGVIKPGSWAGPTKPSTPSRARPLRIGIDARLAFRRGVGTYAANLIQALARRDARNRYVIFNAPSALKALVGSKRFEWVDVPLANAALYEQVILPRLAANLGLDLLHFVDNSASALTDLPFVVTLHDTMFQRPIFKVRPNPTFRQRLVWGYKQWAIPRSAPRASAILTVSQFSKGRIVEGMGLPEGKVFVTPEGVDRGVFKPIPRKPSRLFKVLVHGAADERKNLSNILKAAKRLVEWRKEFQLTVIGMDGKELSCTNLLKEEAELGIGRQVDWVGNVDSRMLQQVYGEADLLLYPSRWEGFGLPVLEAFASGVPVVTSNTTSLPEVAGKAALLVNPDDPGQIAAAVRKVMEKPALRRQLVRRGFERLKLFTWDRTARMTLEVYRKVAAGGGRL